MTDFQDLGPFNEAQELLSCRLSSQDDAVLIEIDGELDLSTAPALTRQLDQLPAIVTDDRPVVMDLTRLTFIASVGLSVLIAQHDHWTQQGIHFIVVAPNGPVLRALTKTGLDQTLTIVATVRDAVRTTSAD